MELAPVLIWSRHGDFCSTMDSAFGAQGQPRLAALARPWAPVNSWQCEHSCRPGASPAAWVWLELAPMAGGRRHMPPPTGESGRDPSARHGPGKAHRGCCGRYAPQSYGQRPFPGSGHSRDAFQDLEGVLFWRGPRHFPLWDQDFAFGQTITGAWWDHWDPLLAGLGVSGVLLGRAAACGSHNGAPGVRSRLRGAKGGFRCPGGGSPARLVWAGRLDPKTPFPGPLRPWMGRFGLSEWD